MADNGYIEKVLEADRSYISLLIAAIFLAASFYCAIHIFKTGQNLIRAENIISNENEHLDQASDSTSLVDNYILEIAKTQSRPKSEKTDGGIDQASYIFEIYIDELRSPAEIMDFIIDVLIRLGLIGTIIGFILMLQSFVSGPSSSLSPSAENIQELLITMSSGMGTALYTTFAGLVASTLLGIQQMLLNKNVERVIAALIRISDVGKIKKIQTYYLKSSELSFAERSKKTGEV